MISAMTSPSEQDKHDPFTDLRFTPWLDGTDTNHGTTEMIEFGSSTEPT